MKQRVSISIFILVMVALGRPGAAQEIDCLDYSQVFPRLVNVQPTDGRALSLAIVGDLGYLAEEHAGMSIWDLTDPKQPRKLSHLQTPYRCTAIFVSGDYAYVGHHPGVLAVDISDPLHPIMAGQAESPTHQVVGFVKSDGFLFVADWDALAVMDISTPHSPILIESATRYWVHARVIAKAGNLVFTAGYHRLNAFDVSNPANPISLTRQDQVGDVYGMAIRENRVFLSSTSDFDDGCYDTTCGKFVIVDFTDPFQLDIVSSITMSSQFMGTSLILLGDLALINSRDYGINVVDISDHLAPRVLGHARTDPTLFSGEGMALKDDVALVGSGDLGLMSYDLSGRLSDDVIGIPGYVHHMLVEDGFAYLANGFENSRPPWQDTGLAIVDVSDPENFEMVASVPVFEGAFRVAKYGSFLYLTGVLGFNIVEVSDPAHPINLGNRGPAIFTPDGVIANGHLITAVESLGLQIYDLEPPIFPTLVASLSSPGSMRSLILAGDRLFISHGGGTFSMVDVSDPRNPVLVGTTSSVSANEILGVLGNFAYASRGWGPGLSVLDISDPNDIREVHFLEDPEGALRGANNLAFQENLGYLAAHTGIFLLDFSDPSRPEVIRKIPLPHSQVLGFNDGSLVAATMDVFINLANLHSLPTHCFKTTSVENPPLAGYSTGLIQNHPNPFNPRTTIAFELAERGAVDLKVFDLKGRLTRTLLAHETRSEGPHSVVWDGKDEQGAAVPAGVYFYRLEAGKYIQSKKMVLLK